MPTARVRPASAGMLARRIALLALFEDEFRPGSAERALERIASERNIEPDVQEHAARIVTGASEHRAELDARIAARLHRERGRAV